MFMIAFLFFDSVTWVNFSIVLIGPEGSMFTIAFLFFYSITWVNAGFSIIFSSLVAEWLTPGLDAEGNIFIIIALFFVAICNLVTDSWAWPQR